MRDYLTRGGHVRTVSAVDVEPVCGSQALENLGFASAGYAGFAAQTVRAVQVAKRRL